MRRIETPLAPQTFTDGLATFWQTENVAAKGNRPVYEAHELLHVPFEEKKIGDVRYYAAMQADSKISKVIRIPRVKGIQPAGDVVTIAGDTQTYVVQKTAKNSLTTPESMDVTLELAKHTYTLKTEADADDD